MNKTAIENFYLIPKEDAITLGYFDGMGDWDESEEKESMEDKDIMESPESPTQEEIDIRR